MQAAIEFVRKVNDIILNPLIVALMAVGLAMFLFGMVEFIGAADNSEKKQTGQRHMLWGVVGLAVMISVYGILNIVLSTLNVDPTVVNLDTNEVNLPDPQFDFGLDN